MEGVIMKDFMKHLAIPLALILILLAGASMYLHWPKWITMTLVILSALAVIIGLLIEIEGIGQWFLRRGTQYGLMTLIGTLLIILLLGVVNWFGNEHFKRWDVTRVGRYTLSDQTIRILKNLKQDIRVIGFFTTQTTNELQQFLDLIEEFKAYTTHLKVEQYDPVRQPYVARPFQITSVPTIVVALTSTTKQNDAQKKPAEHIERFQKATEVNEQAIITALIRLLFPEKLKICYLTGHGEIPLSGFNVPRTLSQFKRIAENEQYVFVEIPAFTKDKKDTCKVVMITAPQYEPQDAELELLKEYLKEGGRIWFNADPDMPQKWVEWLRSMGFDLKNDYVMDEVQAMFGGDPVNVQYATDPGNPLSKGLQIQGFLSLTQSMELKHDADKDLNLRVLAQSLQTSWADRNRDGLFQDDTDVKGPLVVAATGIYKLKEKNENESKNAQAQNEKTKKDEETPKQNKSSSQEDTVKFQKEGRIVVISDADWLTDNFLGVSGNPALALNCLAWLGKREILLRKENVDEEKIKLTLTAQQLAIFRFFSLYLFPISFIVVSGILWWRRRKL